MKSVVLKHLAREFDIEPRKLRILLRTMNIPTENGRYQWSENSPKLKKLRSKLGEQLSKSREPSTHSPIPTAQTPSPQKT